MDFKTVLVEMGDDEGGDARIEAAAALAALGGDGHVVGVTATGFRPDPFRGAGEEAGRYAAQAEQRQQQRRAADEERLRRIVAQAAPGLSCAHMLLAEDPGWALALQGRLADIILVARPPVPDLAPVLAAQTAEYVLLNAGRPVLVLPPQVRRVEARHVAVAWDGRREAARAVADALPLLRRAQRISLVSVDPEGRGVAQGDGLAAYLARHGIRAELVPVPTQEAVGPALLRAVGHLHADLLVAGGYGHSRVRELVMGGATRVLMRHAEVPLLMSH
ncbi:hypothetical protein BKK79_17660 [Cupriavidus sp. USMAA2-4]|uniref:Universal stress protein n=1 Tax=Cupriavidus malaysiensis TaxID=367825 RepID=A0ABN4TPT6_9BURK|nr:MULTISPECIES: universal stress protein [Cupriavidus]AOY93423.1 hypothetical protein BKK79_17660 [Cupriavidus sp. USMAA2-4]AOZ07043.1 hypothetical protein BKK80_15345 [Cupriavidus malaysiensis]